MLTSHYRTWNYAERTIIVLKSIFRCLLKHLALYYGPIQAEKVIYARAVLPNIAVNRHEIIDVDNVAIGEDNLENEYNIIITTPVTFKFIFTVHVTDTVNHVDMVTYRVSQIYYSPLRSTQL